jgi:hypothetical protein
MYTQEEFERRFWGLAPGPRHTLWAALHENSDEPITTSPFSSEQKEFLLGVARRERRGLHQHPLGLGTPRKDMK